ncbi:MAG TPA: hypothetical protein VLW50_17290 [Streptosporangiaceae bacterium]|nr:hypothetical protein [Streptosporangiaceae bacterium]
MKRYKFQALLTSNPSGNDGRPLMAPGQMRRMVIRGEHHETHSRRFFSALVAHNGDSPHWLADRRAIVTIALVGDDPRDYFDIGDQFALWLGSDIGRGIVSRRLYF